MRRKFIKQFLDQGDHRWVGMWWGGFLLGGLLLILVSIPFFAFPKVLTLEKKKIRLMEKAASSVTSNIVPQQTSSQNTKCDSGYGKDIKGKQHSHLLRIRISNFCFRYSQIDVATRM